MKTFPKTIYVTAGLDHALLAERTIIDLEDLNGTDVAVYQLIEVKVLKVDKSLK